MKLLCVAPSSHISLVMLFVARSISPFISFIGNCTLNTYMGILELKLPIRRAGFGIKDPVHLSAIQCSTHPGEHPVHE